MAKSQTAFLVRGRVPDRQALQDAIKSLHFRLAVDASYVPFECSGYLPCILDGEDSGFEIRFGDSSAPLADVPFVQAQIGDRDVAIIFRWSGDLRERVSAMIVSAALAQSFGALVFREGGDSLPDADRLLSEARAAFAQLQEHA